MGHVASTWLLSYSYTAPTVSIRLEITHSSTVQPKALISQQTIHPSDIPTRITSTHHRLLLYCCTAGTWYEYSRWTNIQRVTRLLELLDPNKPNIVQEKEQPTTIVESFNIHTFIARPLLHRSHRVRPRTDPCLVPCTHTCGTFIRPILKTLISIVELPPTNICPSDDAVGSTYQ